MRGGIQRDSLVERLLAEYEATGILPSISGGDDDNDGEDGNENTDAGSKDGNTSGEKGGRESKSSSGEKSGNFKPITTQEDLDAIVVKRLRRQEKNLREEITQEIQDALKADADKKAAEQQGDFKKLYEESQSEVEKLKKKLSDMESEVKQKTIEELRAEVVAEFKLPESLADRLRGETKEELTQDAKKLSEVVGPREAPDIDTGRSGGDGNRRKKTNTEGDVKDPKTWGLKR